MKKLIFSILLTLIITISIVYISYNHHNKKIISEKYIENGKILIIKENNRSIYILYDTNNNPISITTK